VKTIYFVRHGEAEVNVSETFGAEDTPLTDKGREQARSLAERCSHLSAEVMLVSTMERAKETASYISRLVDTPVEFSDSIRERKRPSSLIGKHREEPEANRLHEQWTGSFFKEGIRVEDAENFQDLKERAKNILAYLEDRPEGRILIVMHGFMMRMLFAYIIFGETLTASEFYKFIRAVRSVENTGLSVVLYDPEGERETVYPRGKWSIRIWNDHAHLG